MAHPWVLSVVGALAAVVLFLAIPRWLGHSPSEAAVTGESPALSLVGGGTWFGRWWPLGATWPFVRLDQYSWGIRIGPNLRWMGWLLPTTDLPWSEILFVRRTTMTLRFTRRSTPSRWVSFGPGIDGRLISTLQEHGVEIRH